MRNKHGRINKGHCSINKQERPSKFVSSTVNWCVSQYINGENVRRNIMFKGVFGITVVQMTDFLLYCISVI